MSTWIILTVIVIWFVLPAFLIIAACMHSSRLSRAEEASQASALNLRFHQTVQAHAGPRFSEIPKGSKPVQVPVHAGDGLD